jgi:hypothetical protein
MLMKRWYDAMRGCRRGVQVADAFTACRSGARPERDEGTRCQIATATRMEVLMMVLLQVDVTYGQSAWCEP